MFIAGEPISQEPKSQEPKNIPDPFPLNYGEQNLGTPEVLTPYHL